MPGYFYSSIQKNHIFRAITIAIVKTIIEVNTLLLHFTIIMRLVTWIERYLSHETFSQKVWNIFCSICITGLINQIWLFRLFCILNPTQTPTPSNKNFGFYCSLWRCSHIAKSDWFSYMWTPKIFVWRCRCLCRYVWTKLNEIPRFFHEMNHK